MHPREVHGESRVSSKPGASDLPFVDADVVAEEMNLRDVRGCLGVDFFENLEKFELAFSAS